MTPDQVTDAAREAIVALLVISAPAMLVALFVGILVALFQALTSIQESTLTFVPKIVFVFATLLLTMPFMAGRMQQLAQDMFARMAHLDMETPGVAVPVSETP